MSTRIALIVCVCVTTFGELSVRHPAIAQEPAATASDSDPRNEILQRFVGVWDQKSTLKPAKWNPDGGKVTGKESTVWALKNRILLTREMSQPDGRKTFLISTYDRQKDAYPFWCFDSNGLPGTQWLLKWNAEAETAVGRSTDSPPAWTSGSLDRFPDADTIVNRFWMRDENGTLLMEVDASRDRLPIDRGADIVAAWQRHEPADDLPAELKVLDRMIGTWDAVSTMKPAEWTPEGSQSTMKVKRQWILNGRFVMGTLIHSDGQEGLTIIGFDPNQMVYRSWHFDSNGQFPRTLTKGTWNEEAQTLSYVTGPDDGKTTHSSVRFVGRNQEVWEFKVTDAAGKVYFDMDIVATRQMTAEAPTVK